jgi:dGTPase
MVTPHMLEGISLWEILRETYKWSGPVLTDIERHRMVRQLVGIMVTDMIEATDRRLKESKAKSALDLQKLKQNVIGYSEEMQRRNREVKDFLYKKLYRHYRVVRMQVKAERLITDLFNAYRSEPLMLPESAHRFIETRGLERTICDYIAGMTDRYAIEEHRKLFDPLEKP